MTSRTAILSKPQVEKKADQQEVVSMAIPRIGQSSTSFNDASSRTPNLPATFRRPEIGVVRLFEAPAFRVEAVILKGCGCVNLSKPQMIDSFVGSKNHSFAFFETESCQGSNDLR